MTALLRRASNQAGRANPLANRQASDAGSHANGNTTSNDAIAVSHAIQPRRWRGPDRSGWLRGRSC